jgi:hypothetical protein
MRNDDKSEREIEDEISVREETEWMWGEKRGDITEIYWQKTSKWVIDMILRLLYSKASSYVILLLCSRWRHLWYLWQQKSEMKWNKLGNVGIA